MCMGQNLTNCQLYVISLPTTNYVDSPKHPSNNYVRQSAVMGMSIICIKHGKRVLFWPMDKVR